jgi:hypothetical protein
MAMASGLGSTENHEKGKHNNMRVPALLEPTRLPGDATKADSDLGKNTGHLDHISDVLKRYKHPFILVCYAALYWMGVGRSGPWFDMVIRHDQLKAVAADLIETGHWTLYDFGMETGMENGRPYALYEPQIFRHNERFLRLTNDDTHVLLKRVNQQGMEFKYLQLWSKDKYSINVAECPLIEVPDIYAWHSFPDKRGLPSSNEPHRWLVVWSPNTYKNQRHSSLLFETTAGQKPHQCQSSLHSSYSGASRRPCAS